jgi:hypothetical protein
MKSPSKFEALPKSLFGRSKTYLFATIRFVLEHSLAPWNAVDIAGALHSIHSVRPLVVSALRSSKTTVDLKISVSQDVSLCRFRALELRRPHVRGLRPSMPRLQHAVLRLLHQTNSALGKMSNTSSPYPPYFIC